MTCPLNNGSAGDIRFRDVLLTAPKRQPDVAHDADVVALSPAPDPMFPMMLSPAARAAGWKMLRWDDPHLYRPNDLEPFLREQFFDGKSLPLLFQPPALGSILFLVLVAGIRSWWGARSKHEDATAGAPKGRN